MSDFHFLRPLWLLALVPAAALVWRLWSTEGGARAWRKLVAPHLLPRLLTGREERGWFRPLTVLLIAWILGTVALAGPALQLQEGDAALGGLGAHGGNGRSGIADYLMGHSAPGPPRRAPAARPARFTRG